jgi:CubicO group peptidase (beta-lactamase class C family)
MKYFSSKICVSLFLILILISSCKISRYFFYNFANITDYKIFPANNLNKSDSPFYFINAQNNVKYNSLIDIKNSKGETQNLDSYLDQTNTVAFLIIRNDTILYENYFDDYADSSWVASFSMAKSFTSALIGAAITDGFIKSENEPITKYIPELSKNGFDKVTIKHLLQMTSGIKYQENYFSPFSDAASDYYGRNLRNRIENYKLEYEPGTGFAYKSGNSQLLGLIIERATQKTVTEYLQEKIWTPLQMEYDASWSSSKKENGLEKTFCCLNACALDYAKFGRLYLNNGKWNDIQVIDSNWVYKSTHAENKEGSTKFYQYQWWINLASNNDFSCDGFLGQRIFVYPPKNIIIVRLGKNDRKFNHNLLYKNVISLL